MPSKNILEQFIKEQAHPYDTEKDAYEKPPYDKPVEAGKNTPIYNAHSYHTKVPYQGIIPFIEHYTEPDDLILDPFCGSGMTGVASLLCPSGPRKVILNDLSPAAVHIARNYCTPCDVEQLKKEFERIKAAVKEEFDWLYGTEHVDPETGETIPATIQYMIWSDVYACRPKKRDTHKHPISPDGCGGEIVFWDVAVDHESGQVRESFICPHCGETWRKMELNLLRSVPVRTNYTYTVPTKGKMTSKKPKERRAERPVSLFELQRLEEIEDRDIPYWYPTTLMAKNSEMYIRCALHLRNIERASDFYTKRNLWALARLWEESLNSKFSSQLTFVLTSVLLRSAKITRYNFGRRGNGIITGTLYVSSFPVENNILWICEKKFIDCLPALKIGQKDSCCTSSYHAGQLTGLPDSAVDYIFTDPPFGSNIFYSDCSFLWESWLDKFTDDAREAVWNKSRKPEEGGKTLDGYKSLMAESFQEMFRVLKPNRWATVVFSNSDDRVWESIQDAAYQTGFVIYGGKEFDKVQRSFKGLKGEKGKEKVISKDVLLNLHKPKTPLVRSRELARIADVEGFILQQIKEYLQYLPPDAQPSERTIEAITRAVQRRVLEQGCSMQGFSAGFISDVLHKARRKFALMDVEGIWYPANGYLSTLLVRNETSAVLWLTGLLSKKALRLDEIDPLWKQERLRGGYKGLRGLQDLLEDFFIKNPDGSYRVPDDHERHALKGQDEERLLRECERFADGKLDREPSVEELFNWIKTLSERKHWPRILNLEPHLGRYGDWKQLPEGKATQDRIRLARAMGRQKEETKSVTPGQQQTLF
ncbi:MAG: DNA methyltransferase [Deltaproteobacteria bacterium]|nr:DNA methyltransferase [Deltaproteobacteria bacterium]